MRSPSAGIIWPTANHINDMTKDSPARSRLQHRLANTSDIPILAALIDAAIGVLQRPFLSPSQILASRTVMGLDSRLIADGTYFIVERDGAVAGCGGWSKRATPYGGDASAGRNDRLLDPAAEPARVRAMYTHPDHVRQGVGRLILRLCEDAARDAGFGELELSATLAGAPLYRACGFGGDQPFEDGGVPLIRMTKPLISTGNS